MKAGKPAGAAGDRIRQLNRLIQIAGSCYVEAKRARDSIQRPGEGLHTLENAAPIAMDCQRALQGRSALKRSCIRDRAAEINNLIELVVRDTVDRGGCSDEGSTCFYGWKCSQSNASHRNQGQYEDGEKHIEQTIAKHLDLLIHSEVFRPGTSHHE